MRDVLTRGQLAREAGVKLATVRYYERRGLLSDTGQSRAGYHHYDREAVSRLRFIKRAQELGFSLAEIQELLELGTDPGATCGDIKPLADAKVAEVQQKIRDLQRVKRALTKLAEACPGQGATDGCPILGLVQLDPQMQHSSQVQESK